jgi:Queuine tRNA-ribosyltransferase
MVLAGVEAWHSCEAHAYVKFGKPKHAMGLERHNSRLSVIYLPDRTIHIVVKTARDKLLPNQLGITDFDQIVPLISLDAPTDPILLINPYHATNSFDINSKPFGKKIIVDSGGFQMLRGTTEFVNPDDLLTFYNKFGDICMPLDLPLPANVEPYYFDAVTKMMRANDQYMLPKLGENKILALISQGSTVKNRLKRIDGLNRTSKVVAIAGLNTLVEGDSNHKLMTALTNGLAVIDRLRDSTEYFHFLGVTSNFWFILYSIMAGTNYVKRCGGDSVSYRMVSINGTYAYGLGADATRSNDVKRTQKTPVGSTCRCPVCRMVTDQRLFLDTRLIEAHNSWNFVETKNLIADSVELYLAGRASLRDLADQWMPRGRYELLAKAVDYLDLVIAKGYREWKPKVTNSLFQKPTKTPGGLDHYKEIIHRFEVYHKKKFL